MRGKQTKVACCALWLLFCCSASTPSFVNLPLFCEFEQLGSNSLPIVTKEFVRRGRRCGAKCSKMSKFGEHHRNLGQILLLERNLASEGSFCIFPYRQNLDTRKNCHCCDSTAACLDTFDILHVTIWFRAHMRIFFWSIFGSNVNYARMRADENL